MEPSSFDESNNVLDRPKGMKEEECGPLSTWHGNWGTLPVVISCWKPTKEELQEINKTGRLWLMVVGHTMSPVALCGMKPSVLENNI